MSTEAGISLQLTRVIKATPEAVFRAWTDAKEMKQWAAPEGMTIEKVESDPKVGGRYLIRMKSPDGQIHTAVGVYTAVDRPKRVAYTWKWQGTEGDDTLVTVEFNDLEGSTEVVLTHERFPDQAQKADHEQGWVSCLNRLEALFA